MFLRLASKNMLYLVTSLHCFKNFWNFNQTGREVNVREASSYKIYMREWVQCFWVPVIICFVRERHDFHVFNGSFGKIYLLHIYNRRTSFPVLAFVWLLQCNATHHILISLRSKQTIRHIYPFIYSRSNELLMQTTIWLELCCKLDYRVGFRVWSKLISFTCTSES